MRNLGIVLICLSALGFVLAIIANYSNGIFGVSAEGFSNGCTNLALLSIAVYLYFKKS